VSPDGGVCRGDVLGCGVSSEALFAKIQCAQKGRVRRSDGVQRSGNALTCGVFEERFGGRLAFKLPSPSVERRAFPGSAAVVVDDGVAQNAIEPGDRRLLIAQAAGVLEGAHVCRLQNVFGEGAVIDSTGEKSKELLPQIDKRIGNCFFHWDGAGRELGSPPLAGWMSEHGG